MPLVSMRQLLDEAAKGGYGVGAFNVNDMEQIQAIMEAAKETNSPVIIQASRGARKYAQDNYLYHLMLAAAELYPQIPLAMHLDHGNSYETCESAIKLGFTSVMMDGSLKEDGKTPSTFEENVEFTRKVVDFAHARGVTDLHYQVHELPLQQARPLRQQNPHGRRAALRQRGGGAEKKQHRSHQRISSGCICGAINWIGPQRMESSVVRQY